MKTIRSKKNSQVNMIDISDKNFTKRMAKASVRISMPPAVIRKIKLGLLPKGDCLDTARIAAILAAKNTPAIIPLCHSLQLAYVGVDFKFKGNNITIVAQARAHYATGVEMEALSACAVAALTIYDMAKTETGDIVITDLKLLEKTGGKSGDYR